MSIFNLDYLVFTARKSIKSPHYNISKQFTNIAFDFVLAGKIHSEMSYII